MISLLRWLTFIVSLIWVLVYFKGGLSIVKDNNTNRVISDTCAGYHYFSSMILICAAGLSMFLTQLLICLGFANALDWGESLWIVILGTSLVLMGIAAEFWIRYRYLGRFWSGSVEIKENHQVIEKGLYQTVRHPLYAINLAIYPGVALAFSTWWNWIACIMVIVGYFLLAAYEDRYLAANLPGYREYQKRTQYKFIPGVW